MSNVDTDNQIMEQVKSWQAEMRQKYAIPDEYEIQMNYGYSGGIDNDIGNNVEEYIKYCAQWDKLFLQKADGSIWWFKKDKIYPAMTKAQHIDSLNPGVKGVDKIEQKDSDLFAHFIQVVGVLQRSSWNQAPCTFQWNMNSDGQSRANMPDLDQTVFALTYIRQLINKDDDLFNKACNKYMYIMDNQVKIGYVKEIKSRFNKYLKEKPNLIPLREHAKNNLELIDAFLYGALIIHGTTSADFAHRERYKNIYLDRGNKVRYVHQLNLTLKDILGTISEVAVMLQKDFARWIDGGYIPRPDVFWQETMFSWLSTTETQEEASTETKAPVFGKAYNVEISTVKRSSQCNE